MSNSPLVNYTRLSPNYSQRTHKIEAITIHHMAGNLSIESCGAGFAMKSRKASSNYAVGTDGRIGLYVEEKNRSWCSGNSDNDNRAITIEVANDGGAPNWHVSDRALEATIELCVDICKRNGIEKINYTEDRDGNLTMHRWYQMTACPGPYLGGKFPYIANEINRRLGVPFEPVVEGKPAFEVGERVRLVPGAKYIEDNNCQSYLFNLTLYVRKVEGNYITISTLKTGAISGVVNKKYLVSMDNDNEEKPVIKEETKNDIDNAEDFKLGDEVKLIPGAKYSNGKSVPNWLAGKKLYVRVIHQNSNNITISIFKTGAITGIVNKNHLVKY